MDRTTADRALTRCRILVVEDEYLLADELAYALKAGHVPRCAKPINVRRITATLREAIRAA